MAAMMASTLAITFFATGNIKAVLWSGGFMVLVGIWAWRYPGSVEEHQRRIDAGEKVAWLK